MSPLVRLTRAPLRRLALALAAFPLLLSAPAGAQPGSARAATPVAERIRRVEGGLLPAAVARGGSEPGMGIAERMRYYKVPGVSIAVINGGAIEWARGYGVLEAGSAARVDTGTLFQAASISKPVAAMAALRLAQEGRLDLDEDVNRKLTSWKPPESDLTKEKKVTVRGILSHGAGLTVHGFRGYAAGEPVPTVAQVLNGAPPANSASVRVDVVPGTMWRYAGGGYTLLQLLLTDVTGRPFPDLMREIVLEKVGMTSSSYEQPLPRARAARAASAHKGDGAAVPGKWHTYPEMAAAGLWTTPSDLARFAIEIQRSLAARGNHVLSAEMAGRMLTKQIGSYGLGLQLDGEGASARFSHGGSNEGFRCIMIAFRESGRGVVIMTNGDNGGEVASELIRAVAREYDWPAYRPVERAVAAVRTEALAGLVGRYRIGGGDRVLDVTREGDRLLAKLPGAPPRVLRPESDSTFWMAEDGSVLTFRRGAGAGARADSVIVAPRGAQGQPLRGGRVP
ncbi:MAG: serine hydrolase domain-containing protein [Gemmatimonadaceae bacterium]